ncbi:glycosyltransferase family 4 protein [Nocardioides sp. cx-173]|uniref:glycosyltransferase family 4 protein n=1 Tax=Nocardioides sp. cx-173 TaxID=2898796 RepID=UPI001E4C6909|nr:glycosyltransferase family 4 protein [Nocardioides sp. cx-173]MCD4526407.1 glycosyltransferase family 4 protein [Nocardioides sp. cx-173]UGB43577.1 glycosyltransferase family 4 protein [Nocardioides sp. cx-173]
MHRLHDLAGKHVVFLSWRDTRNPEGGGAERYLEKVAGGLAELGCRVTILCAAHAAAPPDETVDGVKYVRRGSKLTVYLRGMLALALGRLGHVDVVVDVQNGLPFFSRLVTRAPVVVLVHHVHREQWGVLFGPALARLGWWIERSFAPWLYRHSQYVAVSHATRGELRELGVDLDRIAIVHNGTDRVVRVDETKAPYPTIAVVGRLVPHKQVEHAIDAVVALRHDFPGIRLQAVGSGWWEANLRAYAVEKDASDIVTFHGHVDELTKHEIYARAWLLALPSIKEGWGLVIGEAAMHATPTVAYASAGGTRESVRDGMTGLLVADQDEFTAAVRRLLCDQELRDRLGAGALMMSHSYTWEHAQESFAVVVLAACEGRRIDAQDPDEGT